MRVALQSEAGRTRNRLIMLKVGTGKGHVLDRVLSRSIGGSDESCDKVGFTGPCTADPVPREVSDSVSSSILKRNHNEGERSV